MSVYVDKERNRFGRMIMLVHLLKTMPERSEEWEVAEWETADALRAEGVKPLSMLKDRRGGETNNLYLRDLRARVESGEDFARDDWGGCGCGGEVKVA